ncbi:hypothetical protein KR032_003280 [Drosophila birchii]|nr:hypothetical protein KR032_003280 [Drosophila birchii]
MLNNDICETLLAVEQVELSFEQTLRNINNIQHRYNMVSSLKRKAAKAKESFEAEIQAAITEPTPTKVGNLLRKSLKKNKITPLVGNKCVKREKKEKLTTEEEIFDKESKASMESSLTELTKLPKKILKKKIFPRVKKDKKAKMVELPEESPLPTLPRLPFEENVTKTICARTANYSYKIHSTETQIVNRKPYADLIRKLYRAAHWKAQQEAKDQQDLEQSPDSFTYR